MSNNANHWTDICALDSIVPDTGVCALVNGKQVAVFRLRADNRVYAISNFDPASSANVLSRGIVGDVQGERVVASPIYKQHYSLTTGRCVEDAALTVPAYPVQVVDGRIQVGHQPLKSWISAPKTRTEKPRLVLVGNGLAGMRMLEDLLEMAPDLYTIEVFGAEPHGNYNRILLSPVLSGEKKLEDIMLHPHSWYAERGIRFHAGDEVVSIDRKRHTVTARSGYSTAYDRLVLATGSQPIVLPLPGRELEGVTTFRDIDDINTMMNASGKYTQAVVIGGGLLGLEAAHGLNRRGMQVTVIHLADRLMERQLDSEAAHMLMTELQGRGIRIELLAQTEKLIGEQRVSAVRLQDGREIAADLVVMAVGIRPNIALAQAAGLHCERGIVVNDILQTFDPRIYAVGECVQHRGIAYGLVEPLWGQAFVCATQLAERGSIQYRGTQLATQLKVSGVDVFSAGNLHGDDNSEDLVVRDARRGIYKRLILKDNRVQGAVLYGDAADGHWYNELISEQTDISKLRSRLLFGRDFALKKAGWHTFRIKQDSMINGDHALNRNR